MSSSLGPEVIILNVLFGGQAPCNTPELQGRARIDPVLDHQERQSRKQAVLYIGLKREGLRMSEWGGAERRHLEEEDRPAELGEELISDF